MASPLTCHRSLCSLLPSLSHKSKQPISVSSLSFLHFIRKSNQTHKHFLKSLLHEEHHTRYSFELCLCHLTLCLGTPLSSPMIKTLCFQCRGCRFDPCSGNQDPTCHREQPKNYKTEMKTTKKDSCPGQHSAPAPLTLRQDYYCVVWTCHSLFNHSPICGPLGSSQHCGITMPQ